MIVSSVKEMLMQKRMLRYPIVCLCAALFLSLAFTSADFVTMPVQSAKDGLIVGLQWGVLSAALFFLMLFLASWKWLFAVVFPLLTLASAALAYFRYSMNAVLTPMILDAALDNDGRTSADLVSPSLLALLTVSLAAAAFLVRYRWKKVEWPHPWLSLAAGWAGLLAIHGVDALQRPVSERIPFNLYYTTARYLAEKQELSGERADLSQGAVCREDSLTVVLVIGESLRPDHLGINGYERNTTPCLAEEDVISLPNVYAEQTYTMRSIPHLLTRADSSDYGRAYREKSFVHVFNHCGFTSYWLGNQEPAETFVYFMNECDTLRYANIHKSVYVYDDWLDGDLLPLLDRALAGPDSRRLIILHTIGSHWWYNSHFTEAAAKFRPVVRSRVISSCTPEEMVNSYDNTVVYTDWFLAEVIRRLKDRKAILFFQSDHGEALGEGGAWLHASETPEAHRAAGFLWMSPAYKAAYPAYYRNAVRNRTKKVRTDYLFPSILDAAGIDSDYKDTSLSILR